MLERIPEGLRPLLLAGAAAWAIVGVLLVAWIIGQALLVVRVVFPPVLVALITVYLLAPLVHRLSRVRIPRPLGLAAIYLAFIGALSFGGFVIAPVIAQEAREFADDAPQLLESLIEAGGGVEQTLRDRGIDVDIESFIESAGVGTETVVAQVGRVTRVLSGALALLTAFIMGPILAFYILIDLPRLQSSAIRIVPESSRERVVTVLSDVNAAVGGFVRGQLLISLIVGVLSTVALLILQVPYAVAIGALAGFTNLIPFVGPFVGGAVAALVAWFSLGVGPAIWVIIAFVVIQQLESQVVAPNVMRATVRIHPATAILSIVIGAILAGIWGMLLAIPVMAAAKAAAIRLWFPQFLRSGANETSESADGDSQDPPPGDSLEETPASTPRQ